MGSCGTKGKQRIPSHPYNTIPQDTETLKDVKLPTLIFHVLINDVKISKCSFYEQVSLKISIEDVHTCEFALNQIDRHQKARWKMTETFSFAMTEYALRHTFAVIEVFDRHHQLLGSLFINMFCIWTGPQHLDFKMQLDQSKDCRVALNFKISQECNLVIENLMTEYLPITKAFLEEKYTYSIEAIFGQDEPPNYAYQFCIKQLQPNNSPNHSNGTHQTINANNYKIIWLAKLGNEITLPKFDRNIAYYQLYTSSLHIVFWKIIPRKEGDEHNEIQAHCFISLLKLMTLDYQLEKDATSAITYMKRTIDLQQKLWLHGKEVGQVKLQLKFALQAHQKQMHACVRTEDGILTATPAFHKIQYLAGEKDCSQISELKKINNQLQKEFIDLNLNSEQKGYHPHAKQNLARVKRLLAQEVALLQESCNDSVLLYDYKDELELYRVQSLLIEVAYRALTYMQDEKFEIHQASWLVLNTVLKRGEFRLTHLGFSKTEKEGLCLRENLDNKLVAKIEVGIKYQQLLNHLLKATLRLLEFKGDAAESEFAEFFCAYAYFRIPLFRHHILSAIKREDDPQILEWRGTEFNLYQDSLAGRQQNDDFYGNLFDWENNFTKCLQSHEQYLSNWTELQSILTSNKWEVRLAKRKGAFQTFLSNLAKEIEYVSTVSKYIKWQYLPGYNRILHVFLVEMKSAKISSENIRFKNCCIDLLANEKLLNIFVMILLKKTNINDTDTLFTTFDLIDEFFNTLDQKKRPFPSTFDFKFFLEAIKIVFENDLEYVISQVLCLIYNHFHAFPREFTMEMILYLLSAPFFRLFFHWSYNLRYIFHTLLYIMVHNFQHPIITNSQQSTHQNDYQTNLKMAISARYENILDIIKDQIQPNATGTNQDRFHEKDLFRKMRFKLKSKTNPLLTNGTPKSKITMRGRTKSLDLRRDIDDIIRYGPKRPKSDKSEHLMAPSKLMYFNEEEMILVPFKPTTICYVRTAIAEYRQVVEELNKKLKIDPTYQPVVRLKKMLDQNQIKPITIDEW